MKRMLCAVLALAVVMLLAGCEKESAKVKNAAGGVGSVESTIAQQIENSTTASATEAPATEAPTTEIPATEAPAAETQDAAASSPAPQEENAPAVDVDLTRFSGSMLYSEVYNMMCTPEDYLGKIVKMRGAFNTFGAVDANGEPVPDAMYYACVIADATACCQQGLEFILAGDYKYPEDYPKLNSQITVVGEFQTYMEGEYRYCHLINAEFCA